MKPLVHDEGPSESKIQELLIRELLYEGWYCVRTHGNMYQSGFPDVLAANIRFGTRWIEMKKPGSIRFTSAQLYAFGKFSQSKIGVWVLTNHDEYERNKLMKPSNWTTYLSKSRGITIKPIERITKTGPEGIIQNQLYDKFTKAGWFVLETYGSMYQSGLPDMFICHPDHGSRWIEVKNPEAYVFTPAQVRTFPCLAAQQVGIWVLTSALNAETDKIFGPPNWFKYMWK